MAAAERPLGEFDHVAVIVADLDRALALFTGILGLAVEREATLEDAGMRIAFLAAGSVRIELIEPLGEEACRERLGDAEARIEHLAFVVEDLRAVGAATGFELAGGVSPQAPATPFVGAGAKSLFSRPDSSGGITFQFMEKLEEDRR